MAISEKYGKINIIGIGDDEPVFIIRARDMLSEHAILTYKILASSHNLSIARDVEDVLDAFILWDGEKKMPD